MARVKLIQSDTAARTTTVTAATRLHDGRGTRDRASNRTWIPTRLASTMAGSRSDMYRLATNAIVKVASPPAIAPRNGARTAAVPARRTRVTTPPAASTVRAGRRGGGGRGAGGPDARGGVARVTSKGGGAGGGNPPKGNSESSRSPWGRKSCAICVGRNLIPNKLPPLSARVRLRAGLNCE